MRTGKSRKQNRCALARPVIALRLRPEAEADRIPVLTEFPAGRVFEIDGPAWGRAGMVQVSSKGERFAIFADDLNACALEIKSR
jgi:hypothetical protein